ncbi:GNAT family N-acetyltransferase [Nonomuraea sp. NPDC050680]|uniref:GNAT family N-acetyltransferase n=1 Tax=Nonomuraea sp. NPDC050680 TaxID=3154630 RepID=UPI0033CB64A3
MFGVIATALRVPRAIVFATWRTGVSAAGHVLAGGGWVPPQVGELGVVVVFCVAYALGRRERGMGVVLAATATAFQVGGSIECGMPELIAPTTRLHIAWLEAHAEWGPGFHEDGFGLLPSDAVDSPTGFAAWVARLLDEADQAKAADADGVRCAYRWIVEGDRVLGGIALRYGFSEFVEWAGHIGYGIRPSERRRGLAGWALGRMLDEARELGMDQVLVVCAADNVASVKTIESHGGVLEGIRGTRFGPARRYWIKIGVPGG